ncbi:MAG TPA: vWA domain-containing protein [Candidatus Nanopelagicales bacterium]|nr:vWA domain-containing protein [Candidatus Nanopelagicales bacterium]
MSSTHGVVRRRSAKVLAGAAAVGVTAGLLTAVSAPANAVTNPSDNNPNLNASCGMDVILLLDESNSMTPAASTVKAAAAGMLDAFQDTNSRVGVIRFTKTATIAAPLTYDTVATNHGGALGTAVAGYAPTTVAGQTNWQDALSKATGMFDARVAPRLIIVVGDGQPNIYNNPDGTPSTQVPNGSDLAINPAIDLANTFKTNGGHMLGVLLGNVLPSGVANVSRITQKYNASPQYTSTIDYNANSDGNPAKWDNDVNSTLHNTDPGAGYNPAISIPDATAFVPESTDFMVKPTQAQLTANLRSLAAFSCARSLTVTERSTLPTSPVGVTNGGAGWAMSATVSSDPSWTLPSGATGATANVSTDASGTAVFQWASSGAQQPTVGMTLKPLYSLKSVVCTIDDVAVPGVPQTLPFTLPVTVSGTQAANCIITTKYNGKPASFVSISPTSHVITYGGLQRFVGLVRTPSTTVAGKLLPIAGAYVNVQSRPAWQTSAKWTSVGRVRTSATGVYSIYVKPTYNRVYRVVYGGSTKVLPGFSRVALIRVAPKLTSAFRITSTRLSLAGTVRPVSAGQAIWLEKLVGRTWKVIATKKITSTGTYAFTWVRPASRAYYRIVKPNTTFYAAAATPRYLG